MTVSDLALVLEWAAAEGWNPGQDDAEAFLAADPDGFFVTEEGGSPVAAISVVNHTPDFAFLGLYLCRPSHRGRGIGFALWQHALAHAGDRTVGLDGVPDQQENYVRSGFVHAGSTVRYAGDVKVAEDSRIRLARSGDVQQMIAAEAAASGWEKTTYLTAWFAETTNRKTLVLDDGGVSTGFATVRKCRSGAKIGPLIARDADAALRLIRSAGAVFDKTIVIDVPAQSAPLADLCRALELAPTFHTARMYRGKSKTGTAPFYAVASLELG